MAKSLRKRGETRAVIVKFVRQFNIDYDGYGPSIVTIAVRLNLSTGNVQQHVIRALALGELTEEIAPGIGRRREGSLRHKDYIPEGDSQ